MRHVRCENREISYLLEQKPVKNRISEFIKMAVYFFPPIPMFPLQRSMRLFWAKPPISLPHRISLLKLLDISPAQTVCQWRNLLFSGAWFAPESCFCRKRNRIYGWRLSVSERQKHHRLQQKATVGYPILGPSMWSDFGEVLDQAYPSFKNTGWQNLSFVSVPWTLVGVPVFQKSWSLHWISNCWKRPETVLNMWLFMSCATWFTPITPNSSTPFLPCSCRTGKSEKLSLKRIAFCGCKWHRTISRKWGLIF